jgi:hypothetical protein
MSIILDGLGSGSRAIVTDGRLQTESNQRPFMAFKAKGAAASFLVSSNGTGAAISQYLLYFKNDSTTDAFVVKNIHLQMQTTDVWIRIHQVTGTAAGGSSLTPKNLNLISNKPANATARGNGSITGLTSSGILYDSYDATGHDNVDFHESLLVGPGQAIAIELDAAASQAARYSFQLFGYFSDLRL